MPLDTSSPFAEAIRALEKSRAEAIQQRDDAAQALHLAEIAVRDIDEVIDVLRTKAAVRHAASAPAQEASTGAQGERFRYVFVASDVRDPDPWTMEHQLARATPLVRNA